MLNTATCPAPLPIHTPDTGPRSFRATLTPAERRQIDRALRLLGRHLVARDVFDNSPAVKQYLALALGGEPLEVFAVLFLDWKHRALALEKMAFGGFGQTDVYPSEVARSALRLNASAVVLAHNHPSGDLTPSKPDQTLTETLKAALALIDVRLLDHVIVSGAAALSMAERGLV